MFPLLALAICLQFLPFPQSVLWAMSYGFWVSLAPILYVLFLLKTGRIAELHMTNKRERLLPYAVAVACALLMLGIEIIGRAPQILRCVTIFNILELTALGLITTRWLISMHSTATTAVTALIWLIWGAGWALLVGIPLIALVAVVRLFLRRHTPAQVVAGWILGVVILLAMGPFGCFV